MINNRQNGRRRGRGPQQPGNNRPNRPEQGNRIDNRARGNANQLHDKYKALARDAQMQGDRVLTEYYLQFADHYFRVLSESRQRFEEQRRPQDQAGDYDRDGQQDESEDFNDDFRTADAVYRGLDNAAARPASIEDQGDGEEREPRRDDRQPQRAQRDDRGPRDDRNGNREPRQDRQYQDRQPRAERAARDERPIRDERPMRDDRPQRDERPVRELRLEIEPRREPAAAAPPAVEAAPAELAAEERPRRRGRPRREDRVDAADAEPARLDLNVLPPSVSIATATPAAPEPSAADNATAEAPKKRRTRRPRAEGDEAPPVAA